MNVLDHQSWTQFVPDSKAGRLYNPNLRVFHLMLDLDHWEWTASMRDELVKLGATAGLYIQVTESEELKLSRARFANR